MAEDYGAAVNAWVNVVRRARLDRTTKLVALMLATYADPDGRKVYPGLARLTVQCRIDYRTARRALRKLRQCELIEVTKRGARKRGQSDEYRLILGPELLEKVAVPSPEEEREDIATVSRANRSTGHQTPLGTDESVKAHAHVTDQAGSTGHEHPVEQISTGQNHAVLQGTGDPPPSMKTSPYSEPSIHSGRLAGVDPVDRPHSAIDRGASTSGHAGADAPRLDLADGWMNDQKPHRHGRRPWAELQAAIDAEETDGLDKLAEVLDGMDEYEERTAAGMVADGAHIKTVFNKIRADRRAAS